MRRALLVVLLLCTALANASAVHAVSYPTPSGYVNDLARALSSETVTTLNQELAAFEASTTNQISVAVVRSLEGDYIEHYAVKLFEAWGVGTKEKDNGVLLVIAVEDRELRIEVGYGLEGALPDALAQAIITNEIVPRFKVGDYDGGVVAGVRAIMAATRGEYQAVSSRESFLVGFMDMPPEVVMACIMFFVSLLQVLASMFARSKSWWAGGIVGGVGGLGVGWLFALSLLPLMSLTLVLVLLGMFFDHFVSKGYREAIARGERPPRWTGGSLGRGSGGGGFGGFGGGSSGGGGASGRW